MQNITTNILEDNNIYISKTNRLEDCSTPTGFEWSKVESEEDFEEIIKFDHSPFNFSGGHRKEDNFLETTVLWADVDNIYSDEQDWITVEEFMEKFKKYNFIVHTSRSHQKVKNGAQPRDKFHIFFILDGPITDKSYLKNTIKNLIESDLFTTNTGKILFDKGCKDLARFSFGNPDSKVFYNLDGESILSDIDELRLSAISPFEDSASKNEDGTQRSDTDQKSLAYGVLDGSYQIKKGERHNLMGSIAGILRQVYGFNKQQIGKKLLKINSNPSLIEEAVDDQEIMGWVNEISGKPLANVFWKNITHSDETNSIKIDTPKLLRFLQYQGFFRKKSELGEKAVSIRNEDNVLDIYCLNEIRDFVGEYLKQENRMDVFDSMISYSGYQKVIDCLKIDKDLKLFKADKSTGYFFFKNGVVQITNDKISKANYESFEDRGCLWRKSIKNRSVNIIGEDEYQSGDKGDFEIFFEDVCRDQIRKDEWKLNEKKYELLQIIYGYLIHTHKEYQQAKAVVLIDGDGGFSGKRMGGTGKSLLMLSVGEYINLHKLPADRIDDSRENRFIYSGVTEETDFLLYNDASSKFNFSNLLEDITGTMKTERKGQDQIVIDFESSPKIGITTNHSLLKSSKDDNHTINRRMVTFEIGNYYTKTQDDYILNSHSKKFEGRQFYSNNSWDDHQWDRFYNFGFRCLQKWLSYSETNHSGLPDKYEMKKEWGLGLTATAEKMLYSIFEEDEDEINWFRDEISNTFSHCPENMESRKSFYDRYKNEFQDSNKTSLKVKQLFEHMVEHLGFKMKFNGGENRYSRKDGQGKREEYLKVEYPY
jgi:hypothetical protein